MPPGYNALFHGLGAEEPGYPYYDPDGPGGLTTPAGYLPIYPGVDAIDKLESGDVVGDNDWLGPSRQPFPSGPAPGDFAQPPSVEDTVLRTNALQLQVAQRGTSVAQEGSDDLLIGRSGGQANLFGNIPGRNVGVDVSLSLKTTINAIERIVDQDVHKVPLESGDRYPAHVLQCRQVWTGAVQNFIPSVRLEGNLRISPAITSDGALRIARVTVNSPPSTPTQVALSACLLPVTTYAAGNDSTPPVPLAGAAGSPSQLPSGVWPADSDVLPVRADAERFPPSDVLGANAPSDRPCGAAGDPLLGLAALSSDGSHVNVGGEITVNPVSLDVLIGDV